ncbi:MAG: alpha/beta fold hydrolase, partial [Variovorax sp.]
MPAPIDNAFERGLRNRRETLGDAWVDSATGGANTFNADFQSFITRYAWHEVWGRPGLPALTRRIIVLVSTASLGRWEEFELHCRAALSSADEAARLTPEALKEVLLQLAIYAGVPAANTAMAHALKLLRELGLAPAPAVPAESAHPGYGREASTRGPTSLHYTVREPLNGAAPRHTVVLSHAVGCDLSMWDAVASLLATDCRVVCYDHRGHGSSDCPPGPYRMADLADDAARLLDELGREPVVWVGLSLGGMVGQELALREPQRLQALVIANACAGYDEPARAQWAQRIATVQTQGLAPIVD